MYAYCELHIMLMVLKHNPNIARTLDMTCYRKICVRRYLGKPTLIKILFDVKFQKEHCIFIMDQLFITSKDKCAFIQ